MKTTNLIPPNTEYLELNFVGECHYKIPGYDSI